MKKSLLLSHLIGSGNKGTCVLLLSASADRSAVNATRVVQTNVSPRNFLIRDRGDRPQKTKNIREIVFGEHKSVCGVMAISEREKESEPKEKKKKKNKETTQAGVLSMRASRRTD